jgi:hypothetical protein
MTTPEELAKQFHEAYERLAPSFGYETRKASAVPWESVPEGNKRLMTAICAQILLANHSYVSTACHHQLHDQCRSRCKFCEARCLCPCHPAP